MPSMDVVSRINFAELDNAINNTRKAVIARFDFRDSPIELDVNRKDKKLTPTMKAMEAIEEEAGKAGITFSKAIEVCCANSWAGFKASWLAKAASDNPDYSSVGD